MSNYEIMLFFYCINVKCVLLYVTQLKRRNLMYLDERIDLFMLYSLSGETLGAEIQWTKLVDILNNLDLATLYNEAANK